MKLKTNKTNSSKGKSLVCKTVSLPSDLFAGAQKIISGNPELDFSKYVRGLIRADINLAKPQEKKAA